VNDLLTDQQLLRDYAANRSESAFSELVRRHVDLVYSAARRMVGDSHQAQDVTQAVFMALAQNAGKLTDHPVLSGWLHRTTQNLAANAVRANVRRQIREQEAAAMNELIPTAPDVSWEQIAPHLDTALGELADTDRDAVLLRYFERKSATEMAQILGVSDEAAQKRVSRAVERLREYFAKRGITIGAGGLVAVVSANAVQAAPAALALTISTAAALSGTTIATAATATATKAIAMTTIQKALVTATVAVLAGAGIYEARQASQLRDQVRTLQQLQAPLAEQVQQLTKDHEDAARQLTALRDDNERLNRNTAELLRLRGEVGLLKREQSQASQKQLDELKDTAQASAMKAKTTRIMLAVSSEAGSFAYRNKGLYPTNVSELNERFSETWLGKAGLSDSEELGLDRFEFVPHERRLTTEDYGKLLLRERTPRRDYSTGRWARLYTYVGGVSAEAFSDDGNFDRWESEETKHPTLKRPPDKSP
jgi:RNA polymerase sigma factor (sigma-70 family)